MLQDLVDQAKTNTEDALTADIRDAIKNLQDAISQAASDQDDARDAAQDAITAAAPVSNEAATKAALDDALNDLLANETATADQINDATAALTSAVNTATTQRTSANDDAATAISQAQSSNQSEEPTVQAAEKAKLQDLLDKAATGDADALTADIEQATQDLADAVAAAGGAQDAARTAADEALTKTAPVTYEPNLQEKIKDNLQDVLDNAESTPQEIVDATNAYNEAVADAKTARDDATKAAEDQITTTNNSNQVNDASVIDAKKDSQDDAVKQAVADLTAVQDAAANDDATTADIEQAVQKVVDAVKDAAQTALDQDASPVQNESTVSRAVDTAPVSQEDAVMQAQSDLDDVLDNPDATTAEVDAAKQALEDAVAQAKSDRTDANTTADDTKTQVAEAKDAAQAASTSDETQAVADDPGVVEAQQALQDAIDNADADTGTTQAITDATAALENAVARAEAGSATGNTTTKTVMLTVVDTAPVSQEADVQTAQKNLDDLVSDPNASDADVATAKETLEQAVQDAQTQRETTTKTELVSSKDGLPADEAAFLSAVGYATTDNQQYGDSTVSTDYDSVMNDVKADGKAREVTITVKDGKNGHALEGKTNEAVDYDDASLAADKVIDGYTITSDTTDTATNYDDDTSVAQDVTFVYRDTQAPTVAADNLSATYTITYDTITEEAPATRAMLRAATDGTVSQESVVTYGPLDQTVNVTFKDEVGRILTSDTVTYTAQNQTVKILQQYADGTTNGPAYPQSDPTLNGKTDQQVTGTITAPTGYEIVDITEVDGVTWEIEGKTGEAITAPTGYTDAELAKDGYTYLVKGPDGTIYDTMAEALVANATFDDSNNGSGSDIETQTFETASISADGTTVTLTGTYDNSKDLDEAGTDSAVQNTAITLTQATQLAEFKVVVPSWAKTVSAKLNTIDTTPQNLLVVLAPNNQTATVTEVMPTGSSSVVDTQNDRTADSYSYTYTAPAGYYIASDGVTPASGVSPTVPDAVPIAGVTGDTKSGTITAPDGYYIVSVTGDQYSVVYTDETHQEATYSVILDDTNNGNETSGYYFVASGQPSGVSVAADGRTATLTFNYDNTTNLSGTDSSAQTFNVLMAEASQSGEISYSYSNAVGVSSYDSTINGSGSTDSSAQAFEVSYKADYQSANVNFTTADGDKPMPSIATAGVTSGAYTSTYTAAETLTVTSESPISAGTAIETASGVTDGKLSFAMTDASLALSGYTYTVTVVNADGTRDTYNTLSAAVSANMEMTHGYTYTVTVQNADGTMVVDADGNPVHYATLADAVAANDFFDAVNTGIKKFILNPVASYQERLYDNTTNAGTSDATPQTFTVVYAAITQTAEVVVGETSDIYSGQVLAKVTGDTGAALGLTLTDADLAANLVIGGDTQISSGVTLDSAAGVTSGRVSFATTDSALALSGYTYTIQTPNGTVFDTLSAAVAGSQGSFTHNDSSLSRSGYSYVVYMGSDSGTTYSTLSAAMAANSLYNNTNTTDSDADPQVFTVSYVANYQSTLAEAQSDNTKFDNTSNAGDSDAETQMFLVSYTAMSQAATIVGAADSPISAGMAIESAAGVTSEKMFTVTYTADTQWASLAVTDDSPINAGSVIGSLSGKTATNIPFDGSDAALVVSGYTYQVQGPNSEWYETSAAGATSEAIAFADTADSDLYVQGYHYTVTGPDGSVYSDLATAIAANSLYDNTTNTGTTDASAQNWGKYATSSYATLSSALAAESHFDNTPNGSATSDSRAQQFVVIYTADSQTANIVVDTTSPISAGQTVGSSDTAIQSFLVSYKADYQTAEVVLGESGPYASDSVFATTSGVTSGSLSFSITDADLALSGYHYVVPVASGSIADSASGLTSGSLAFTMTDSGLAKRGYTYTVTGPDGSVYSNLSAAVAANSLFDNTNNPVSKSGYTYTVKYGSDATAYTTLSSALAAHNKYNSNNTTSGTSDANPDVFTVSYKADSQTAILAVTSNSNTGTTDTKAQFFYVSYAPMSQAATVAVTSDSPISAGSTVLSAAGSTGSAISFASNASYATLDSQLAPISGGAALDAITGVTSGAMSFKVNDTTLPVSGYTYRVGVGYDTSNITWYATLSEALSANAIFDNTDAKTGYTYTIIGPTGSSYANLTAALASNALYDNTTNGSATTDSSAQAFRVLYKANVQSAQITVQEGSDTAISDTDNVYDADHTSTVTYVYRANHQEATLAVDSASPTAANSAIASASGVTSGSISFNVTDAQLNATAATVDAQRQLFEVVYSPDSATVTYHYVDENGTKLIEPVSSSGVVGAKIDDRSMVIPGYTLIGPVLSYSAVSESANGPASSAISFSTTDSQLTRQGYTYVVRVFDALGSLLGSYTTLTSALAAQKYDNTSYTYTVTYPGDSVSYATLSAALATHGKYDDTANSGSTDASGQVFTVNYKTNQYADLRTSAMDTSSHSATQNGSGADTSAQVFTVSYVPQYQAAQIRYADGGPISAGSVLASAAGTTNGTISFAVTDNNLARVGLVVDANSPIRAASVLATSAGYTDATLALPYTDASLSAQCYSYVVNGPNGSQYTTLSAALSANAIYEFTTTDATIAAKSGYRYVIYGPDNKSYSTLSEAQAAYKFDSTTNTTSSDAAPQTFWLQYYPAAQLTSNVWDATSNAIGASDGTPQNWTVSYVAQPQQANLNVQTFSYVNGAYSAFPDTPVYASAVGTTGGAISNTALWNGTSTIASYTTKQQDMPLGNSGSLATSITDASLARSGYSYAVIAPNSSSYPTMAAAFSATTVGDKVGITTLSSDASTADYTYAAPTIKGYTVSKATNSVKVSQTASKNTITITYNDKPTQQSIIQTKAVVAVANPGALSIAVNATNGGLTKNDNFASIDTATGTLASGVTTVNYVDQNNNAIASMPATTFRANGNLIAMNKSNTTDQKLFTNGINMTTWNSVVKYTITWNPTGNNGQPSISGQLSSTNNAGSWSFDTASDWVGLVLTPTDPSTMASDYKFDTYGGGGLGIQGFSNAVALGLDFYGSNSGDPAAGPFGSLRRTDASWSAEASSVTDPAGQTYAKLTANVNNTSGYYYLNRQFDTSKSFTITGYFKASTSTSTQNLQPDGKWSVATVEPEIWYEIGHEIHEVLAAPVVSTTTIDQVTDVNANRTVNWAASDVKTHGEYAGAGKYDSTTNWLVTVNVYLTWYSGTGKGEYCKFVMLSCLESIVWGITMVKTKDRKKMYKSGKFWVAAGLTAATVGGVAIWSVAVLVFVGLVYLGMRWAKQPQAAEVNDDIEEK
ncbi:KxYKxGKxW signal peptide domain-containing protein [Weissella confusa]|uniref:KxYKxGKxW signal peptide domain-containing protein n=1 Tax=Weissella confusa TaxID=1583 RepID=A0A923NKD2_WEICO|nr:KxYKxGKxW signal peptide domain-containing protein [Weissella confusa]